MRQLLGRGVVGIGVSIAAVGLSVSVVSAHVTIDTLGEVEQGSFAKIGLSVPNERDDAGTVLVQVQMPSDTPIPFVSVEPVPGWEITTTTTQLDPPFVLEDGDELTEAIETITWTATGDTQIGPGQFQEFWISAGPMPTGVDSLSFPAIQTYSSGEEVAWIDPPNPDGSEPDRPAPTLQLVAGTEGGSTETTVAVGSSDPANTDDSTAPESAEDDDSDESNTLAVVALIVGGVALVAAIGAIAMSRKRDEPRPSA